MLNLIHRAYWPEKYFKISSLCVPIFGLECRDICSKINELNENEIYLYSLHSTFSNDLDVAQRLNEEFNLRVISASKNDVNIINDKINIRSKYGDYLSFIPWSLAEHEELLNSNSLSYNKKCVIKARLSTKGSGVFMADKFRAVDSDKNQDYLVENFVLGREYSVNVIKNKHGEFVVLPVVYKDRNCFDLIHPKDRRRSIDKSNTAIRLQDLSLEYSKLLNIGLIAEFEYLIDDYDNVYLLEVNPRISGTLKLSLDEMEGTICEIVRSDGNDLYG